VTVKTCLVVAMVSGMGVRDTHEAPALCLFEAKGGVYLRVLHLFICLAPEMIGPLSYRITDFVLWLTAQELF
jgi:hypothetical protein